MVVVKNIFENLIKFGNRFFPFPILLYVLHDKFPYLYDIERCSHMFGFDKYFCKNQFIDLKKIIPFYTPELKKYENEVTNKRIETLPRQGLINAFKSTNGDNVLVIGTIHYHEISKKLIKEIITNLRPDIICIEYDKVVYPRQVNLYEYKLSPLYLIIPFLRLVWDCLVYIAYSNKFNLKSSPIKQGFWVNSQINEFEVAIIESRKLPFTSLHPIDVLVDMPKKTDKLAFMKTLRLIDNNLMSINIYELFDRNKLKKLREKNYEIFLDPEFVSFIHPTNDDQITIRDLHMSKNIDQLVKVRREYLNSCGITSPLWCVAIVGGGHVSGISAHLLEFGYAKVF